MKKLTPPLLLTLILLATTFVASGQLRYGLRLGGEFAAASLKDAGAYSLSNRSGFSGGLVLEYQMPQCGFAPDIAVLYTRYNTRLKAPDMQPRSFGRNFIEVPLHLKYKFWLKAVSELAAPIIYTGPSVMFRLDHDHAEPLTAKRIQAGWDVGIGLDIINFIQISGGYRFGLGNATDSFTGEPEATLHTNAWTISATLLFDF